MVKLLWRLSGNLIYHVLSMKTPHNLQTNFTINLHKKYHSPHCLHTITFLTILVIRFTMFFLSIKTCRDVDQKAAVEIKLRLLKT